MYDNTYECLEIVFDTLLTMLKTCSTKEEMINFLKDEVLDAKNMIDIKKCMQDEEDEWDKDVY